MMDMGGNRGIEPCLRSPSRAIHTFRDSAPPASNPAAKNTSGSTCGPETIGELAANVTEAAILDISYRVV